MQTIEQYSKTPSKGYKSCNLSSKKGIWSHMRSDELSKSLSNEVQENCTHEKETTGKCTSLFPNNRIPQEC